MTAYYIEDSYAHERNSLGVFILLKGDQVLFYCDEHGIFWRTLEAVNSFANEADSDLNNGRKKTFAECRPAEQHEVPEAIRTKITGRASMSGL